MDLVTDVAETKRSLRPDYEARLATDLQQNQEEHERVTAQIAELNELLRTLEQDRAMLLSMQRAVSAEDQPTTDQAQPAGSGTATIEMAVSETASSAKGSAQVPAARKEPDGKKSRRTARAATTRAAKKPAGDTAAAKPKATELVREYVAGVTEPKSAAEVAQAISTAHPSLKINANAVRMGLEALVAKGLAERVPQGRSVYYEPAAHLAAKPATSTADATAAE